MQVMYLGGKAQRRVLESFKIVLNNVGQLEDNMSISDYIYTIDKAVNQKLERMNSVTGYTSVHTGEKICLVGSSKSRPIKRTIKVQPKKAKSYVEMQKEIAMWLLIKNGLEKCIDFPNAKDVFLINNAGEVVCTLDEL